MIHGRSRWRYAKDNDRVVGSIVYCLCPECNEGRGMYAVSHGPRQPSTKHNNNNNNFESDLGLIGDSKSIDGTMLVNNRASLGDGDLDIPGGQYQLDVGVASDELECPSCHPKGCGRRTL